MWFIDCHDCQLSQRQYSLKIIDHKTSGVLEWSSDWHRPFEDWVLCEKKKGPRPNITKLDFFGIPVHNGNRRFPSYVSTRTMHLKGKKELYIVMVNFGWRSTVGKHWNRGFVLTSPGVNVRGTHFPWFVATCHALPSGSGYLTVLSERVMSLQQSSRNKSSQRGLLEHSPSVSETFSFVVCGPAISGSALHVKVGTAGSGLSLYSTVSSMNFRKGPQR